MLKTEANLTQTDVLDMDKRLLGDLYRVLFGNAADAIIRISECNSVECVNDIVDIIRSTNIDLDYLIGKYGQDEVIYKVLQVFQAFFSFLIEHGLLNTEYKNLVKKNLNSRGKSMKNVHYMIEMAGSILMNAACRIHYLGLSRVGGYAVDRYLLILSRAMDALTMEQTNKAIRLLTAAELALIGRDKEADEMLKPINLSLYIIDRHLTLCSFMEKLHDLGIIFTEEDLGKDVV